MIFTAPRSIVQFYRRFVDGTCAPENVREALPALVAGVILSTEKRTLSGLGRAVWDDQRHAATVGRMLEDRQFRSRDLLREAVRRAILDHLPGNEDQPVKWFAALDGTSLSRGAETKIKGANRFGKPTVTRRKKQRPARRRKGGHGLKNTMARRRSRAQPSTKKRRETKAHTFLMGVLITHTGFRIPLPRRTCDPRDFKREGRQRSRRQTQVDLAVEMLKEVTNLLPPNVKLVVAADEAFEGEKLIGLAQRRNFTFIAPVTENRCYAESESPRTSNGCRLYDEGLKLQLKSFEPVDLVRGGEGTARHRRYAARKPGPKDRRTYFVHGGGRTVAKLGLVGVVHSWKSPHGAPLDDISDCTFKVLVCSDPGMPLAEVVEWYELRWTAIEIFFRELKQHLGLGHYVGTSLYALERFIDLVLLSFLCLEVCRIEWLDEWRLDERVHRKVLRSRTLGLQQLLRREANERLYEEVERAWTSPRARRRVRKFLAYLEAVPTERACAAYPA